MMQYTIRLGRLVLGVVLLIVGAILSLPLVPGPGLLLVFLGVTLLGNEFHWARRLRDWMYRTFAQVRGRIDGSQQGSSGRAPAREREGLGGPVLEGAG